MFNKLAIALVSVLGSIVLFQPSTRSDCLPTEERINLLAKDTQFLTARQFFAPLVFSNNTDLRETPVTICSQFLGNFITFSELDQWRTAEGFSDYFATVQLYKTCQILGDIEFLKHLNQTTGCETDLLGVLASNAQVSLSSLRTNLNIWKNCQIDSHMPMCTASKKQTKIWFEKLEEKVNT